MKKYVLLAVHLHLAAAATNTLQYFYTAVTPGRNLPEFTAVGLVDGEQFMYYDSEIGKMIPKTEWMKKAVDTNPHSWEKETDTQKLHLENYKVCVESLTQCFNCTGVHTLQVMFGCEWRDDGSERGHEEWGYDGEDFMSLDLDSGSWTAAVNHKAIPAKEKWEERDQAKKHQDFLLNECPDLLQKYLGYGREALERKVPPEASLFQKNCSSPVVCVATGFFPKAVNMSWKMNGEDLFTHWKHNKTQPNQDGTFQKRSVLSVSPEDLEKNNYTCVIQHSSLEGEMELQVSERRVPPVPPEASLFQNDSSSPVMCLATGFCPKALNISWKTNGEDLYENVEIRETLLNQDGTFQKRSVLTISPEDLEKNNYTCVIQHSSLEEEMELQVSERRILSEGAGSVDVIVGVVVSVLLLFVLICVGVYLWKKKRNRSDTAADGANPSNATAANGANPGGGPAAQPLLGEKVQFQNGSTDQDRSCVIGASTQ